MTRLVLADEHAMFLHGFASLLREHGGFDVVDTAADGNQAWEHVDTYEPDVVVVSINLKGMSGLDISTKLCVPELATKTVILGPRLDHALAREAFACGADGYLLKDDPFDVLIAGIAAVQGGSRYVTPRMKEVLDVSEFPCMPLSSREKQVIGKISQGRSGKEIGIDLGISPRTVETYRRRVMAKLGLHNVADIIRFSICSGITE